MSEQDESEMFSPATPTENGVQRPADERQTRQRTIRQRKRARRAAIQALFEIDSVNHAPGVVVDEHLSHGELNEEGSRYFRWLVSGVVTNASELDTQIHRYAPEWPVDQLAIIDRNLLRLSLFELDAAETDAPPKVVINEAVELGKELGTSSSASFINGVMHAIAQELSSV